ncbi:hypothetical protein ACIBCU_03610 [Streptomyces sp. NPDC051064]|uniref:hypothetical protein n=1 Tax=Streptomyces sp. NPDC051064 TaxID=3365641 RepID=UPI0037A288A1
MSAPIPETVRARTEYSHSSGRQEASIPMRPTAPTVTSVPIGLANSAHIVDLTP